MVKPKYMIDGEYAPPTSPSPNINPTIPPDGSKIETVEDAEAYITHAEEYGIYLESKKDDAQAELDAIVEAEWPNIGTAVYTEEGGTPTYLYKTGRGSYTQKSFTSYQQDTDKFIDSIESVQEVIQGNIAIVSAVIEGVESDLVVTEDADVVLPEPVIDKVVSQPSYMPYESKHEDRVQPYIDAHLETSPYKAPETKSPVFIEEENVTPFVPASNIGLLELSGSFGAGQGWGGGGSSVEGDPSLTLSSPHGPASGPRPRSLGKKIQDAIMEPITELEELASGFESEMSGAGKQMGVEAQQALVEGDYLEAGLKGMASASALLGAGAFQDLTFFIRPLAMGAAVKGIGQIVSDRDLESEEAASQIRDTISKGESDYAGYQSNYDAVMATYAERQVEADLIFSGKEDYTPESFSAWESSWIKYSSDVVSIKTSDPKVQKDYQEFMEWRSEAEDLLVELDKSPRTRVSESVVNAFTSDQGAIVQFVGGIFSGYLMSKGFSALKGPTKTLTRLDDLDITVRSTTLDINQFPEAELFPTTSMRRLPKIVSEILEPELDDLSGGRLLGVADDGSYALLTKIDLPEGVIDDLLEGKTVDVQYRTNLLEDKVVTQQGTIGVENIVWGNKDFVYVDEITSPISGTSILIPEKRNVLTLNAKELGGSIAIPEPSTGKMVDFDSLWDVEGTKGILPKGKYSFDIKGIVFDSNVVLDDILDEIQKIESTSGSKTPWAEHFQQPGYTEPLGELGKSLADDMDIVRNLADDIDNLSIKQGVGAELSLINELTQGVVPVSKIITEGAKGFSGVGAGLGIGAALGSSLIDGLKVESSFKVDPIQEDVVFPVNFTESMEDIALVLKPPIDVSTPVIDFVPIIDIMPIGDLDITKPITMPIIVPKPVPPIEEVYPIEIPDVITIPELDQIPIPVQGTTQVPQDILDMPVPPGFSYSPRDIPFLIRMPTKKKGDKLFVPFMPMGWEMKKYPESKMLDILGISMPSKKKSTRKKRKPSKKRTKK